MTELTPKRDGHPMKIVRDRTPELINSTGEPGDLFYGTIGEHERQPWLARKLIEETAEYAVSGDLDELGDVLAVVEGLAATHGLTLDDLREHAARDPRGGFLEGRMMYGFHPEYDGRS